MKLFKKAVWGIKIVPERVDKYYGIGLHGMNFYLEFAMGKPGRLFYSGPEVARFIEKTPKLQNTRMGHIIYRINPSRKIAERTSYYPFGNISNPRDKLQRKAWRALTGKGIARQLWEATARHVKKTYPGFAYREGHPAMYYRGHARQLESMGIKPGQEMRFKELFGKMKQATKKYRQKRRLR